MIFKNEANHGLGATTSCQDAMFVNEALQYRT